MMLEWTTMRPADSDGEPYTVHYLVDPVSKRCYACIPEPRQGNMLYQTDVKFSGEDRFYTTLEAAKDFCEAAAWEYNERDAEKLAVSVKETVAEEVKDGAIAEG